jgi:hypothetical protein
MLSKVELVALMQRLEEKTDEDSKMAYEALVESQKWFGNFNVFKYPWWAKSYWLGVLLISLAVYVQSNVSWCFFTCGMGFFYSNHRIWPLQMDEMAQ